MTLSQQNRPQSTSREEVGAVAAYDEVRARSMSDIQRWENEGGLTAQPRLRTLHRRHSKLDEKLEQELRRPQPCQIELQRLRREKLYLKDEIRSLKS